MRIKVIIATLLYLFFGVNSVFAVTFNISNPQQYGDEIIIDVSLSGLTSTSCPNGSCYLQAAFTPNTTNPRYFGFTKNNNGEWYEYIRSPEQSYIQSTFFAFQPVDGTWSGQLTLKINAENSNYSGPGTYYIKAWRYSGNSSSGASGNTSFLTVDIQGSTPTPSPNPTVTPIPATPTPTLKLTPTPTPKKSLISTPLTPVSKSTPTNTPSSQKSQSSTNSKSYDKQSLPSNEGRLVYHSATVAAATTSASPPDISPAPAAKGRQTSNLIAWIGAGLIITGITLFTSIYLRNKNLHETISDLFRKRN